MKKAKKIKDWLKVNILNNFNFKEHLLMIFFVGCFLPMLLVDFYMYLSTRNIMLNQAKKNAEDELTVIADSIKESMSVIEDVSKRLYFDETIEHIAFTDYESYEEILEDYRDFDTIENYLKNYYQDISNITIYTYNTSLANNKYFVYADASVKSDKQYINAMNLSGSPYWSYTFDSLTNKYSLNLSRVLYTKNMEKVGMASIDMQTNRTELPIKQLNTDALLFYDNVNVLNSNTLDADYNEISNILISNDFDTFSDRVTYNGQEYLLSFVKIYPDYSEDYYTLVSLKPYSEILKTANISALKNLIPMFFCIIVALFMISMFSNSFSKRINVFKDEMHKAATGNFELEDSLITGSDEIALLHEDLTEMIKDINILMERVVTEQVQKEQLNTRQREVEFKMLASQINPHFLYNTLETIRMQARVKNEPEIEELTKMLAKIMRRNIQAGDTMQSVKSELQLMEYYLKIQDYRFHDRISYLIEVENNDIYDLKILPLLIQPFVENAYAHGLESKEKGGIIKIRLWLTLDSLYISIYDNGQGMSKEKLEETRKLLNDFDNLDRTHIGICNVNERIKLCYGEKYGVTIDSNENIDTTVTINLPKI